jgi:hypothetical protein
VIDPSERPRRDPPFLRINPGPLPEAAELWGLLNGLYQVRDRIRRETAGAVSPTRQLFAVEALMRRHHEVISEVMKAVRERNAGAISARDDFMLVLSLVEHATFGSYWLLLAWGLRKLPVEGRPNLSVAKSKEKRRAVLGKIQVSCRIAQERMDGLITLVPGNKKIEEVFRSLSLRLLCVQISATRHALFSASEKKTLPREELESMLGELDRIRSSPDFSERSAGDRNLLWQTATILYDDLGDDNGRRRALREQRSLTVGDPDARMALLMSMIDLAEEDEERFALVAELARLPGSFDPGPLFSQDRIGRVSTLRDELWSAATAVDPDRPLAAATVDEVCVCYRSWAYGNDSLPGDTTVRLVSDWGAGEGRIRWVAGGRDRVRSFELDPRLVDRFYLDREAMRPLEQGAGPSIMRFLDQELAPLLSDVMQGMEEVRLIAGGSISALPLLGTMLGDSALGAIAGVAYAHPNPDVESRPRAPKPFDLLVLDTGFGDDSAAVRSAFERVSPTSRVLEFDSTMYGTELDHQELADALESASGALFFSHVDTPALYAGEAAILTGPKGRFRVDILAALDLRSLEELALIGCASGRPNLFLGDVAVAHAAAMAGARQILYSLWPIRPREGSAFAAGLAREVREEGMNGFLAARYREDRRRAGPFAMISP